MRLRETKGLARHFREASAAGAKKMRRKRANKAHWSSVASEAGPKLVPYNPGQELSGCPHCGYRHPPDGMCV